MSGLDRRQVERVFLELLELPQDARAAALHSHCGDDAELRSEVERLLRIDCGETAFLSTSPLAPPPSGVPTRIGNYEVASVLGEGGMGMVYEARQASPRRTVALKIIRPGFGGGDLVRRLRREAQALGLLQHPGIACIYEAGAAEIAGLPGAQPFIAMELVQGLPITEYAQSRRLTVRERADLVARVADAVQHAHDHGVIHRDLKPRNIFVDQSGQPKVLDFGIAKLAGQATVATTMHTATGGILGTLDYMSPEQVAGVSHKIDARSDVYALGAVLFELLAGHPPHRLGTRSMAEALRIIRDDDAPKLTRLPRPDGTPGDTKFDTDLSTIVAKALEKDPLRRYTSAALLASDLRHYLSDEPIVARPTTAMYQVRKFAQRNKVLVGGVIATMAALLVGLVSTARFAAKESTARRLAEERFQQATVQSYRASLTAAQASIESGDLASALIHLEAAPASLRGWEWQLSRRMADNADIVVAPRDDGYRPRAILWERDLAAGLLGTARQGQIAVWNMRTGAFVLPPSRNMEGFPIAFLPGGESLLVGRLDLTLSCVDVATGAVRWQRQMPPWRRGPMLSPDGDTFTIVTGEQVVIVDAMTGRITRELPLPGPWVDGRINTDGRLLGYSTISACGVYDLENGRVLWEISGFFHEFSRDGRFAVVGLRETGNRASTLLIDPMLGRVAHTFTVASMQSWSQIATLSPDAERVLIWDQPKSLALHDVPTGRLLARLSMTGTVGIFAFESNGARVSTVSDSGEARCWLLPIDEGLVRHPSWHSQARTSIISNDARLIARCEWGSAAVVDISTGRVLWRKGLGTRVVGLASFSPDGSNLAVHDGDGRVLILDTQSGAIRSSMRGSTPDAQALSMAWGPAGLAIAWSNAGILLHDPQDLTAPPRELATPRGRVKQLLFTTDGASLMALTELTAADASAPGASRWSLDIVSPASVPLYETDREISYVGTARIGRSVFIGHMDGSLIVHPLDAGGTAMKIPVSSSRVIAAEQSPDRQRLATMDVDGIVSFWDASQPGLSPVLTVRLGVREWGGSMRFSQDGATLVIAVGNASFALRTTPEDPAIRREAELWLRATTMVEELRSKALVSSEIGRVLQRDSTMSEQMRQAAMTINAALGDSGAVLNSNAWGLIRTGGASKHEREAALLSARAAHEAVPDSPSILNTLGTALYRNGHHEEALAALHSADKSFTALGRRSRSANWAMIAMALRALGREEEARQALEQARQLAVEESPDVDAARIVAEAEATFSVPPPGVLSTPAPR